MKNLSYDLNYRLAEKSILQFEIFDTYNNCINFKKNCKNFFIVTSIIFLMIYFIFIINKINNNAFIFIITLIYFIYNILKGYLNDYKRIKNIYLNQDIDKIKTNFIKKIEIAFYEEYMYVVGYSGNRIIKYTDIEFICFFEDIVIIYIWPFKKLETISLKEILINLEDIEDKESIITILNLIKKEYKISDILGGEVLNEPNII
ncbi:MAG: hypothetical protein ACRCZK_04780 [Oscillospiraceae bacterium]